MSDKKVYITFRDYEELNEYTTSRYVASTGEKIIFVILKSINGNEKYDNQRRVLKSVGKDKLIFEMILPNDDTLEEHSVFGYRINLQSIYPTIAPKTFFAKSIIPEMESNIVKMYFAIHKEICEKYIIHRIDDKEFIKVISVNGTKMDCPYPINISYDSTFVDHMNNECLYVIYTIDVPKKYLNFKIAHNDYMHIKSRYTNDVIKIFLRRSIDKLFQNNKEENNMTTKTAIEITATSKDISKIFVNKRPTSEIKEVIFHYPATIVYWTDGTKTVVKCQENETSFDREKGLAMAIAKKFLKKTMHSHWYDMCFEKYLDVDTNPTRFGDKEEFTAMEKPNKDIPEPDDEDDDDCYVDGEPCDEDTVDDEEESKTPTWKLVSPARRKKIIDLYNKGKKNIEISREIALPIRVVDAVIDHEITVAETKPKKKRDYKRHKDITFYKYLTNEESKEVLEKTKKKYEGTYKTNCILQKLFERECKVFYIKKHYGNGYSAYEIGKTIGICASAVMRLWNLSQKEE